MTRQQAIAMILQARIALDAELGTAPDEWPERPEAKCVRLAAELGDVSRCIRSKTSREYVAELAELAAVALAALESSRIDAAYFVRDTKREVARATRA